ncbi:GGDEF domain-containing protein [Novosphingobium album (ex Liu et al. 2023)]|uniref:diguanylate cyclase n=1 Tax=Novosphingobium album (ex Liu et al. 2023) TaxID=3031130 RepID=A0ABT5WL69_9SPHN|nr:diguanylate cyclase [Novosphingobium album (ex Liu et al. 2023)]MDE8650765.1 GGDEF domain-containing protein [Novosphingobium album (ex Liu et al. 2023)]
MIPAGLRHLLFLLLGLCAMSGGAAWGETGRAPPDTGAARTCHAGVPAGTSYAAAAARPGLWNCAGTGWSIARPRVFVRFDLGATIREPQILTTRLTRFDRLRLIAIGVNGRVAARDFSPDAMAFASDDWLMRAPVPDPGSPIAQVVMQVDGARHAGILSSARIDPPPAPSDATTTELVIAWLCGLLCVPLIFNFAFFRVLRQRFVLWHASAVLFMLMHTIIASGIINRFTRLSMMELSVLSAFTWAFGVVSAGLFLADLIEPGKLGRASRTMLRSLAVWVPFWTTFYLFAGGPLRALVTPVYNASFIPVIAVLTWAMIEGARHGSRAVWFPIMAWTPLILTSGTRLVTSLGLFGAPMEMLIEQHIAIALEIIITSFGVADRFMIIRRQRDGAIAHTKVLAGLAERDPLTGLYNRRVIEDRFDDLFARGFHTMAVIDLDHFKVINDTYGHAVGDSVLQTVAVALMPDTDTIAVRIGGEEFLLLLRGHNAADRAERRRRAIPSRVAGELPGLDRIVTASMGMVIHQAGGGLHTGFAELYAHCDRLLYDAKDGGRNRTCSEAITGFAAPARAARG